MNIKPNMSVGRLGDLQPIRRRLERLYEHRKIDHSDYLDWCFLKRWFPEVGTMGEPFLDDDERYGVTRNFLEILKAYRLPLYVCTKGNLLIKSERYFESLLDLKENGLIVDVSLISSDDDRLKKMEPFAPPASERLKLAERLSDNGVDVTISARPFLIGLTDRDWKEFVRELCDRGAKSIHVRNFYITGKMLSTDKWKKYVEKNSNVMERYGVGYKYKVDWMLKWFRRFQEVAQEYDVTVTGSNRLWFELEGTANKMEYEKLSQETQDHLFPYTIHPLFKKVKENADEPQVLRHEDFMPLLLDRKDPILDEKIEINNRTHPLLVGECSQFKVRAKAKVPFQSIVENAIWDGDHMISQDPFISKTRRIYAIESGDGVLRDDKGHRVYYYHPEYEIPEPAVDKGYSQEKVVPKSFVEEMVGSNI